MTEAAVPTVLLTHICTVAATTVGAGSEELGPSATTREESAASAVVLAPTPPETRLLPRNNLSDLYS